jgi:hypothetical protein
VSFFKVNYFLLAWTNELFLHNENNYDQKCFMIQASGGGTLTLSKTALGRMIFSIITLRIKGLFVTLSINGTQHNDTQHNDTQLNDTQYNDSQLNDTQLNDTQLNDTKNNNTMLSASHVLFIAMLNAFMLVPLC